MKKITAILLALVMMLSFAACGSEDAQQTDTTATAGQEFVIDEEATTLTIGSEGTISAVYTAADLEALGTIKATYSGRNRDVQNARQFTEFEGVELGIVLKDAGFETEDAVIKVVCSDGYTREYEVDDLYGLYAYKDNESNDREEVVPIIAIVDAADDGDYPAPYRLVYGQADYDTNDAQDYNMQGWARFVQYIEVSYE